MNEEFFDDEDIEDYPIITMQDDETGEDIEFMVMDSIEVEDTKYFLVIETKDIDKENPEALLLKENPSSDGKDIIYSITENEIEFESVIELLNESSDDYDIQL